MRFLTAAFALIALAWTTPATAEVHVDVHIDVPAWRYDVAPRVVVVPGIPEVHYAPDIGVNFFTYGGRYYTYDEGRWFVAYGGHGPWTYIERHYVPAPVLSVPVRYYHVAPRLVGGGHWHGGGKASYHHGRHGWDDGYGKGKHGKRGKGHGKHGRKH